MPSESHNYADVLRYTPGACVLIEDGAVVAANPEAVETTGIPLGRLLGVPIAEFVVTESEEACSDLLARASMSPTVAAVRFARALMPIELSARRLPDERIILGLRSMASEHYYSALAAAELTHDPLTGFSNRYHLLAQLQERLSGPSRSPLALVGLWIDELPELTASRGDRAVDRVVKEVGGRLQGRLRSPDVLGRFDQAGFVTLLTSDASVPQLTEIATRLRDEVAFPVDFDGGLVSFTASVAVASLVGRRPSIERVLAQLDTAAEKVAVAGGNRTELLEL